MGDRLKHIREKQKKRRELLAKQLGVDNPNEIRKALSSKLEQEERAEKRQSSEGLKPEPEAKHHSSKRAKGEVDERRAHETKSRNKDESTDELEIYKDSSTFLKGTQSLNPHNDYCQNYVDTDQRPQNYIRDVGIADRFEEYPKLKDLNRLKDDLIRKTNIPPMYLKCDLENFDLRDLKSKFEVILIQPPLEEYRRQAGLPSDVGKTFSWDDIMALEIEEIAAPRSFVFLWCGSSDGLDHGRQCLKKWGFRRCEDICWIKTNFKKKVPKFLDQGALFCRTKEHCLMGIKGTVRRSTDGDFIHANVDIDLIIDEEQELGNEDKPEEIFHLIEHFCLSRRRLHLFGTDSSIRPGWLTLGPGLTNSNFDAETHKSYFYQTEENPTGILTGCTDEIERLRPKTPPPREKGERGGHHGGRGRGGHSSHTGLKPDMGSLGGPHLSNSMMNHGPRKPLMQGSGVGSSPYADGQVFSGRGTFRLGRPGPRGHRGSDTGRHFRNTHLPGQGGYGRR